MTPPTGVEAGETESRALGMAFSAGNLRVLAGKVEAGAAVVEA
jgi:hypothetical protein